MNYILFSFLFAIWGTTSCENSTDEIKSILLTESTRGTFRSIEATSKEITVVVNGKKNTAAIKPAVWKTLLSQAKELPLHQLESVPILSKRHQVDAALHATLRFVTAEETFTTSTFDHNAPPDAFKSLIQSLYQLVPNGMKENFPD